MAAGHHGVNFVGDLVGERFETISSAGLAAAVMLGIALVARGSLSGSKERWIVPEESLTLRNLFDLLVGGLVRLSDDVMGRHNRRFLPFVTTLFFFILFCNLVGLIPGLSAPTDKIEFNLGISILVFILFNFWGIREHGVYNYLKHFWGPLWQRNPLWLLGLVVFVIECISFLVRPVSLGIRLFANMTADHGVLDAFTNLTKFGIPLIFYLMGTFVCVMQAFIFTLMTMIYIRLAVAHDESHDEAEGAAGHGH